MDQKLRMQQHEAKVECLQNTLRQFRKQRDAAVPSIALQYGKGASNTVRTKSYKNGAKQLDFSPLDEVVFIDAVKKCAYVEPRVTMDALVRATLPFGLVPAIVPEFKAITVGGAIMGAAGESSSHRWGVFSDICDEFHILSGDGDLLRVTREENSDLFYAVPGSYGSLGALVFAVVRLIPAKQYVRLRYHYFRKPVEAIGCLRSLMQQQYPLDFLDGLVFSENCAVVIEGMMTNDINDLPVFSTQRITSEWYYQHACYGTHNLYEEAMTLYDYLFRYDQGTFWTGAYLFHPQLLFLFIFQGILKWWHPSQHELTEKQVKKFHLVSKLNVFQRMLSYPFMKGKNLWRLFHKAEQWIQDRVIIQDFCIPEDRASSFLDDVMQNPGVFPLWLCPIKGTREAELFMPNRLPMNEPLTHCINVGIYGISSHKTAVSALTHMLEEKVRGYDGRKVLYARSYYSRDTFWKIYPEKPYGEMREKTASHGVFHDITEKVLSV